ncbi:hypothetical protein COU18_02535 [Candidatus Kaiserbacteria bacterium CG10_big_fil_rev_8_21_14_0_10_51_14]|uniref:histidine kinase n=1 Tax=Candidatus Kaiserbacteria bacterium CG10_big_fil_rev_8_21_14_0_10_51_14 TaxID=1974610 RepID=A0A2H0UAV3_9BACT|nr:MAG: hypothetical protein COU18_02535 [Candidatus Kaiserbacteria bacterium CG10_big_fil_rev_8_21_14_0_10_51_14]
MFPRLHSHRTPPRYLVKWIRSAIHSTGYGLFIAKEIVDAHGGKIWAESEGQGKGARFVVEFPLVR